MKLMRMSLVLIVGLVVSLAVTNAFAQLRNDTVLSQHIKEADGTSGQNTNSGSGIKTGHIQNGAVTAPKLGIVCPEGQYLQYIAGGWVCSVGTPGPAGPAGPVGPAGPAGPQPAYANVIVVAKSGGDFTDPIAALNSIADASATNTYLVKIMPGTYDLPRAASVGAKSYVDIEGSGSQVTKIRLVNDWTQGGGGQTLVANVTNSEVRNITLEAETTILAARSLHPVSVYGGEFRLKDVELNMVGDGDNIGLNIVGGNVIAKNVKIAFSGAARTGTGVLIHDLASARLEDVTIEATATMNTFAGVYSRGSGATVKNLKFLGSDFTNTRHVGVYAVSTDASPRTIMFYDSMLRRVGADTGVQVIAVNTMVDELMVYSYDGLRLLRGKFKGVNCYNSNYDPVNLNN